MIRLLPVNRWLEPLFAIVIAGAIVYAMIHLFTLGYLPQPFFYDPYDIWMDWFNVADWAFSRGMYDTFGTIYPPLSYVLLRAISLPYCYEGGTASGLSSYYARSCDWLGVFWVHFSYVLGVVLVAASFKKIDPKTALPRSASLAMSLPMTSGLERGQIMLVAFACVVLAFGPIFRSARLRWTALACAINLKVYLICLLFPQLLRRRWRWFEGAAIATGVVYIVTLILLGRGTPMELYVNLGQFKPEAATPLDIWIASTYNALVAMLTGGGYPAMEIIGSRNVEIAVAGIVNLVRLAQLSVVAAVVMAWIRPEVVSMYRLTALAAGFSMITIDVQYYGVAVMIFFVFLERWRGWTIKTAIVLTYLLCLPLDYAIDRFPELVMNTFIYGQTQLIRYYLMLGPFLRPGLLILVTMLLAWATIGDVWADVRRQGWRTRWRFRRDLPIMLGEGAAIPPLDRSAG